MNLNSHELKMVAQMRKELHQWRWVRWAFLGASVLCVVNLTLFSSSVLHVSESGPVTMDLVLLMFLYGFKCCSYLILGIWFFITTITKWHGDPQKTLLLRLLDARIAGEQPAVK